MADQLMSLVRELKQLNARKKAGEALSADDDSRRKELKRYLKAALEKEKGGSADEESTSISSLGMSAVSGLSGTGSAPRPTPQPPAAAKPQAAQAKKSALAIDANDLLAKAAASMEGAAVVDELPVVAVEDPDLVMDFELEPATPRQAPTAVIVDEPVVKKPEEAPKKKDYSAAFKLDASNLFEDALGSEVVAAAAPEAVPGPGSKAAPRSQKLSAMDFEGWLSETGSGSAKGMRNSAKAIEEVASKADEALQQNKTRERVVQPEQVQQQLSDILGGSGYTPPEVHLAFEQYYGEYVDDEGLSFAEAPELGFELQTIDPREMELYRSGILSDDAEEEAAPVPNGLAFLDDFAALYELGVLPPADQEVQFDVDDPNLLIPGKRKVTVHLLNGQAKRGAIRKLARDDLGFRLEPQGTGRVEDITLQQCKAIFVHLPPKGHPPEIAGPMLTVTFTDRRSVQGVSDDYAPGVPMFSLVPPAGPRTGQFERIIVSAGAVKSVR